MNTRNKRNSSSGNLHLLKGMKNTRKHNYTGKYKGFFSYYLNIFKRDYLNKNKIIIIFVMPIVFIIFM